MKNLLLASLVMSVIATGCDAGTDVSTAPVSISNTQAPVPQAGEPVPSEEVVEQIDEDTYQYDAEGILLCEEDEYGVCIDGDKQDIRAAQLKERYYAHDTAIATALQDDAYEEVEYADESEEDVVGYLRIDTPDNVDPASLPPLTVWGSDLSNHMTKYPRETEAKFGQRRLIINGMVTQLYTNGIALGGTFVEVPSDDLEKNDTVTVYCYGVYAGGSWGISAVGVNCSR